MGGTKFVIPVLTEEQKANMKYNHEIKKYDEKYREWEIEHDAKVGECYLKNLKEGIGEFGAHAVERACKDIYYKKNRPPKQPSR